MQNQIKGENERKDEEKTSQSLSFNYKQPKKETLRPRDGVARQKRAMHQAPLKYVENINHIKWKHEIILAICCLLPCIHSPHHQTSPSHQKNKLTGNIIAKPGNRQDTRTFK